MEQPILKGLRFPWRSGSGSLAQWLFSRDSRSVLIPDLQDCSGHVFGLKITTVVVRFQYFPSKWMSTCPALRGVLHRRTRLLIDKDIAGTCGHEKDFSKRLGQSRMRCAHLVGEGVERGPSKWEVHPCRFTGLIALFLPGHYCCRRGRDCRMPKCRSRRTEGKVECWT